MKPFCHVFPCLPEEACSVLPQSSQAPSFSGPLFGLSVLSGSLPTQQKRDIQLLKAYMRAIRSVNPNLQNLEETIEYNEILEWVLFGGGVTGVGRRGSSLRMEFVQN